MKEHKKVYPCRQAKASKLLSGSQIMIETDLPTLPVVELSCLDFLCRVCKQGKVFFGHIYFCFSQSRKLRKIATFSHAGCMHATSTKRNFFLVSNFALGKPGKKKADSLS